MGYDANSGKFYILGGQTAAPRSGDDFSMEGRAWQIADNALPFARNAGLVGVSDDGTIYLLHGDASAILQDGEWHDVGAILSFHDDRYNDKFGVQHGGALYYRGFDDSIIDRFDLQAGEQDSSFEIDTVELYHFCLASWRSYLYVIGGRDTTTNDYSGKTMVYDLDAHEWLDEAVGPVLNIPRSWQACAVNNDKLYTLGGIGPDSRLDTVEFTHANMTNEWTVLSDRLGVEMASIQVVVYGDFIITVGAWSPSFGNVAQLYIIDTVAHTVTADGQLDTAIRSAAPLMYGDMLLVFGGYASKSLDETRYLNLG